jgi:hypothetical protein
MSNWIVMVIGQRERQPMTREQRQDLPAEQLDEYSRNGIFDTQEGAEKFAFLARLAGHEAYIYSPDQWEQRWSHMKNRRDQDRGEEN